MASAPTGAVSSVNENENEFAGAAAGGQSRTAAAAAADELHAVDDVLQLRLAAKKARPLQANNTNTAAMVMANVFGCAMVMANVFCCAIG
eukprot:SAG22_NODE_9977_length_560_cov_1.091106_1_plen_89_part_10